MLINRHNFPYIMDFLSEENIRLLLGLIVFGGVLLPVILLSGFTEVEKIGLFISYAIAGLGSYYLMHHRA